MVLSKQNRIIMKVNQNYKKYHNISYHQCDKATTIINILAVSSWTALQKSCTRDDYVVLLSKTNYNTLLILQEVQDNKIFTSLMFES